MSDRSESEFGFANAGIGSIINRHLLKVPANQRPYAWKQSNVQDLLNDFKEAMLESDEPYFLGTVVLVDSDDRQLIADGQQRIATASIILAAARNWLRDLDEERDADSVEKEFLRRYVRKSKENEYVLHMNIEDNEFFKNFVVDHDWSKGIPKIEEFTYPSNARIFEAAQLCSDFLKKEIEHLGHESAVAVLNNWVSYIEEKSFVVAVSVPDEVGAFRMFETLNDRGLRASQADILKNYFFSKVNQGQLAEIQAYWNQIYGVLSDRFDDPDERMVEYLRHYWTLENGLTRQRDLATSIKKKVKNAAKSLAFLRGAKEAVADYAAIFNPEHPKWKSYGASTRADINTLTRIINIEQIVPLVFAVANRFGVKEARKAFRLFVVWSVRFILGQSGRAGRLDKQYAELAHAVGEGRMTTAKELRAYLEDKVPGDEAFSRSVATAKVSKSVLARYYLMEFERARSGGSGELEPSKDVSKVNLEHVLPQAFTKDLGMSKPEFDDLITRLGNQTIMLSEWNRELGNLPFKKKKATFKKSEITLTSGLAEFSKFDRAEIDIRQKEMADLAPQIWSLKFG